MIAFGPVPSRRLGRSLGVNNIPVKICTYSCVYCQIGRTLKIQVDREKFYSPDEVFREVKEKVEDIKRKGEALDYITFVPDGEPTLDLNLGKEILLVKSLGFKVAVITNSSLIDRENLASELKLADLVSLKLDAVSEEMWRRVDRPARGLVYRDILEGMVRFRKEFEGEVITETMFVEELNDDRKEIDKIAGFLSELKPDRAYIAVPTRPPAERWVKPAGERALASAYAAFSEALGPERVEFLVGFEGEEFVSTGDPVEDLLGITSVHPMREDALETYLRENRLSFEAVRKLIEEGKLLELEYGGHRFYMRKLPTRKW
ncbi:MAG: radical SAM protein [Candidatus Hydrothermae bacterium]|nr:radical SAM protein [Candidatus Hydrothermae bacterium]